MNTIRRFLASPRRNRQGHRRATVTPDTELDRLFAASLAKIPKPEKPMKIDLGHPLQDHDEPKPFDFTLTPAERDRAKLVSIELERQRRAANKRDADQELTKLGVVFTDDGPEAA